MLFCCQMKPLVILLNGVSSSGKSSIARELSSMLDDSIVLHLDEYQNEKESLYEAVRDKQKQYKYVIVDTLLLSMQAEQIHFIADLDVCFVLVYCPLGKIFNHIYKRNQSDIISQHRSFAITATQFLGMYTLDVRPMCFDWMNWQDLIKLCNDHIDEKHEREVLISLFRQNLFSARSIKFMPMFDYDIVVNTGLYDSKRCAEGIITYLDQNRDRKAFFKSYLRFKNVRFRTYHISN